MSRFCVTLATLVLLFAAFPSSAQVPAQAPASTPLADQPLIVRAGDAAGKAQLTAFCDIEEDACERLVVILRRVVESNPETIGVTFRHLPAEGHTLSPLAYRSALAAARQGKGWEFLDMACANRDRLDDSGLISMATQLRLDVDRFIADTAAGDVAQVVDDDAAAAKAKKVTAVPAVFLNDKRLSDVATFDSIDAAIKATIK